MYNIRLGKNHTSVWTACHTKHAFWSGHRRKSWPFRFIRPFLFTWPCDIAKRRILKYEPSNGTENLSGDRLMLSPWKKKKKKKGRICNFQHTEEEQCRRGALFCNRDIYKYPLTAFAIHCYICMPSVSVQRLTCK